MIIFGATDKGLVRKENQDSIYFANNVNGDTIGIVCDGIGGGNAGDVASQIACDVLRSLFLEKPKYKNDKENQDWILMAVKKANDEVFMKSTKSRKYQGMGTTLAGVLVCDASTFVFHSGDSRVYALYDDLICLTEDHNFTADLIKTGDVTEKEAFAHPKGNMLTNALGIWDDVKVEIHKVKNTYSYLLISSDGLHGFVLDKKIKNVLLEDNEIEEKVLHLISIANLAGGFDNTSVIILKPGGE